MMNVFFMFDIVLNFFTAYYDEDMGIVDDRVVSLYIIKISQGNH